MTTPINNLYNPREHRKNYWTTEAAQPLVERLDATTSNEICSRLSSIEKIIYFLAGAIVVAILYRR